jgi:hypothetical protein
MARCKTSRQKEASRRLAEIDRARALGTERVAGSVADGALMRGKSVIGHSPPAGPQRYADVRRPGMASRWNPSKA